MDVNSYETKDGGSETFSASYACNLDPHGKRLGISYRRVPQTFAIDVTAAWFLQTVYEKWLWVASQLRQSNRPDRNYASLSRLCACETQITYIPRSWRPRMSSYVACYTFYRRKAIVASFTSDNADNPQHLTTDVIPDMTTFISLIQVCIALRLHRYTPVLGDCQHPGLPTPNFQSG